MNLKKRLFCISKNEISAVSYCIQKIYEFGFLWSTGHDEELNYIYQINLRAMIKLAAERIMKYAPEKVYSMEFSGNMSKKTYATLLNNIKKHAPRVYAKLLGKRAEPLQRKKQNLEKLLEKAEKYLVPDFGFDEITFNEFDRKMNYAGQSYHGTLFYCNSGPFYSMDINCFSAAKAEILFDFLADRFGLKAEEIKVITSEKKDAWSRNAENEKMHINATEGLDRLGIMLYPKHGDEKIPCYVKHKEYNELYYTAITPIMIGLSKHKLIEIMHSFDELGLNSQKNLWISCRTKVCSDKEYIAKRKHDMHEDLVERLHETGSILLAKRRYHDFFRLASITNRAFDQGDRAAKKIIYDCMGMEPDTYCGSNHDMLMKKERLNLI